MKTSQSPDHAPAHGSTAGEWALVMRSRREVRRARDRKAAVRALINARAKAMSEDRHWPAGTRRIS